MHPPPLMVLFAFSGIIVVLLHRIVCNVLMFRGAICHIRKKKLFVCVANCSEAKELAEALRSREKELLEGLEEAFG